MTEEKRLICAAAHRSGAVCLKDKYPRHLHQGEDCHGRMWMWET